MMELGTYRPEFSLAIRTYAEMRQQYNAIRDEFYASGGQVTEAYTNKAGATNVRKAALYQAMEAIRKDIINFEGVLGLTPAGLKRINDMELKSSKESKLTKALRLLDG